MAGMGTRHHIWTKALDTKLLDAVADGKTNIQLEIVMNMSYKTIMRRLKQMGFDGLLDARRVMSN